MIRLRNKSKGQSFVEYTVLIVFVLFGLLVMQKYLTRGISGRWKSAADVFGHGRQYSPGKTIECAFDFKYTNSWYDARCFYERCGIECLGHVDENPAIAEKICKDCIVSCPVDGQYLDACENSFIDEDQDHGDNFN